MFRAFSFMAERGNAAIISALTEGTVVYAKSDGVKSQLAVAGGFVEVQKNEVALCVELNA